MESALVDKDDFQTNTLPDLGPINQEKLSFLDNFIIQGFYDTIDQFILFYSTNSRHSTCPTAWNTLSVSCSCRDCRISSNNCTCVKCFLEGPHKHHRAIIHFSASGNCDCGDHSAWKPSGTCKCHCTKYDNDYNNNNDDDYIVSKVEEIPNFALPKGLKMRLLLCFNEVKSDIQKMIETGNFFYFIYCCQWYQKFTQLGDEIRDTVIESLNDIDFLSQIILNAKNMSKDKMQAFFLLEGSLTNNYTFSASFLESVLRVLPDLLQTMRQSATLQIGLYDQIPFGGISAVISFCYQYINNYPVRTLTEQKKFDWIQFIININNILADFITSEESYNTYLKFEPAFKMIESYKYVLREIFRMESEKPKMKQFFIEFAKSTEKFEGCCIDRINDNSQNYDIYYYILQMYKFPHLIKKNIPYFVPEVVDIFIYHLLNDEKYKDIRANNFHNYSMATLLHQLFINDMIIYNRRSEYEKDAINNDSVFNICYHGKDPKDTFDYYCLLNLKRKGITIDDESNQLNKIYLKAIELPIASISNHYLLNFGLKNINTLNRLINVINSYHSSIYFTIYIFPSLIAIVQTMLSFTSKDKKDEMIKYIAQSFDAFESKYKIQEQKMRDFGFLFFICSLILDRDCINEDTISICLKNLMTPMRYQQMDIIEIQHIIEPYELSNEKFSEKYNHMNTDTDWNLIIPCYNPMKEYYPRILPSIIKKSQGSLLPFPEFIDSDNLLLSNLKEVFECKYIFASIFIIIYEYNNDICILQYALNLFITFAQNSKEISINENTNLFDTEIHARNINDFVKNIPTSNFRLFAKTKVCFKGNTGISLIQLIDDLGQIGLTALRQAGLSEKVDKLSKKQINYIKQEINMNYKVKREKFASKIEKQSHDCCSICHKISPPNEKNKKQTRNDLDQNIKNSIVEDKLLFIPICVYESSSVDLIEDIINGRFNEKEGITYEDKKYVRCPLGFKYVHSKCFISIKAYVGVLYLMPKIDSLYSDFGVEKFSMLNKYVQSIIFSKIKDFMEQSHLDQNSVHVLARMISVLDHRSRLKPEILDDSFILMLYANLFKNCSLLLKSIKDILNYDLLNIIEKVIYDCFEVYNPFEEENSEKDKGEFEKVLKIREEQQLEKISFNQFLFSQIVQKHDDQTNKQNHHEYLRRCFLIEKYYLYEKETIIDWESLLNYKNLFSHFYHKKLTGENHSIGLPVYRGLKLPKYFLEFIYPPYNISFLSVQKKCSICILTGTRYESSFSEKPKFGMPFTIVLQLYGNGMSTVSLLKKRMFGLETKISNSIYVDKNGFEDPAFQRGSNLMLSQDRYYALIDAFLSGDIIDSSFTLN